VKGESIARVEIDTGELRALAERLERVRDELKELLTESRGAAKDLKAEVKRAKEEVLKLAHETVENGVRREFAEFMLMLDQLIVEAQDRVNKRFDTLADILLGEDHSSRQAGKPSLIELAQAKATMETAAAEYVQKHGPEEL
jgi:uncharacterized protein (UPF0335 family)